MFHRVLAVAALLTVASGIAFADQMPQSIAAGTRLQFHLTAPVSSSQSRTGQRFTFVLSAPLVLDGSTIAASGAMGWGTVYLAGHAGPNGHEGDLTLRIDTLRTADERVVTFDDQRFEINGKNYKIATGVLGFVPFVGIGAHIIRGNEITVDPTTPIETVLLRPATIASPPTIQPSATPS